MEAKKILSKVTAVALSAAVLGACSFAVIPQFTNTSITANAISQISGDWYYDVKTDGTIKITMHSYKSTATDVTVPATIDGKKVTELGDSLFSYNGYIKTVNIQAAITTLPKHTFSNCKKLEKVTLPSTLKTIDEYAFFTCTALKTITIPKGVTTINSHAFYDCDALTGLSLPDSLKTMGESVFWGCESLQSITIPNSVTKIGQFFFMDCKNLKTAVLSNKLTEIPNSTFKNCAKLTPAIIPNNVTKIGDFAYAGCSSLKKVIIPNKVKTIGSLAFFATGLTQVEIPKSVTTIELSAFAVGADYKTNYNFKMYGIKGSAAQKYADQHKLKFYQIVPATSVKLSKSSITIGKGETVKLTATIAPKSTSDKSLTWITTNSKVVTVSGGKLVGKANGTATVSVKTSNGKTATCKVTVKTAADKVKLSKTTLTVGVGEKYTLKSSVTTNHASYARTYTSSNKKIVTVDSNGKITAKKTGTATITVKTFNGKKATCKVTVKKAPSKVTLNKKTLTLKKGKSATLKVSLPKNTASYKKTFTSSNKSVATVSSSGKVTAKKAGTATITVKTFNGKTYKCKVTVKK